MDILFIRLLVDRHLDFFPLPFGVNTAVNIFVQGFFHFSWFYTWKWSCCMFSLSRNCQTVLRCNSSLWHSQQKCVSFSTSFFFFNLSNPGGCCSVSWFWFPFLWWVIMENIFLCIHLIKPFVYLLWRTVCSGALPTSKSDCLFTIELCLFYIPDKSPESSKWFANIFSFYVHIVHILYGVLWSTRF